MKVIQILIILSLVVSCGSKPKTKGSFKVLVGSLAALSSGGAYVRAVEVSSGSGQTYKLDLDNTMVIPSGRYNLLFVVFEGPQANSGPMKCGFFDGANFEGASSSLSINISESECLQSKYTSLILSLKKESTSWWGSDRWDLSCWGQ